MTLRVPSAVIHRNALLQALSNPETVRDWTVAQWDTRIRIARRVRLLASLGHRIQSSPGLVAALPIKVQDHLDAERTLFEHRTRAVNWVLTRLKPKLLGRGYPVVLLKGAAYLHQGLPFAQGRMPADVDLLVPKSALDDAQNVLQQWGWRGAQVDAYDERYYREWSHEIPPLRHPEHGVELDLHHNILPPIARTRVNAEKLFENIQTLSDNDWHVLHPIDQWLHASAHVFVDSDGRQKLRDIVDCHGLLLACERAGYDGEARESRAAALGLTAAMRWAEYFSAIWMDAVACTPPNRLTARLFEASLTPDDLARPQTPYQVMQNMAGKLLLMRYHEQRMPLKILAPHLTRKMVQRWRG